MILCVKCWWLRARLLPTMCFGYLINCQWNIEIVQIAHTTWELAFEQHKQQLSFVRLDRRACCIRHLQLLQTREGGWEGGGAGPCASLPSSPLFLRPCILGRFSKEIIRSLLCRHAQSAISVHMSIFCIPVKTFKPEYIQFKWFPKLK